MATATSVFMRRHSRFPTGIETGGGDTSCAVLAQPTLMGVVFGSSADTYKEIVLPAGTLLIAGVMLPMPPRADNSATAATTGDIKINLVTGGAAGTESTEYMANTAVEAYSRTLLNTNAGYQLSAETRIRFTPSGLDGTARIAVEVVLPQTRT